MENGYLWENFCDSMLVYSYCQLIMAQIIEQLYTIHRKTLAVEQTTPKTMKFSSLERFAMYGSCFCMFSEMANFVLVADYYVFLTLYE